MAIGITRSLLTINSQVKNGVLKRFSLRGLFKVRGAFSLACVVHNLKKQWNMGQGLAPLGAQAA